ncbi:MAG: DUF3617 family protein [Paracoccaceae bacterium]
MYRFFLIVCLMNCAGAAVAERVITVEPGLWEYTHSLMIPGLLQPSAGPKTECITPKDATRRLSDLLEELSSGGRCSVSNLKDTLSTVKFDLNCNSDIESVSLNSTGHLAFRYGRTKITGSATGLISVNGMEMNVAATGVAQRIGRCKKK